MPRLSRAALALLTTTSTACASQSPAWLPFDRAALPKPGPDTPLIHLDREKRVRFAIEDGKLIADETTIDRSLLLEERARTGAQGGASYSTTFERVIAAHSRLIRPDGTITENPREEMIDVLATGGSVHYSDGRYLASMFETIPLGSVTEHHFTVRHLQPELFTFISVFGDTAPIVHARFVLEIPPGFEVEYAVTRAWVDEPWAPEVETRPDGTRILTWSARDLPAVADDDYTLGVEDRSRLVSAHIKKWTIDGQVHQSFTEMSQFGGWYHQIQGDAGKPDDTIRALVRDLLTGKPEDPRQRAALLYGWVQENVRYVAVEVGLGGWRAHPATQVLANKYGDCKDKATLLQAMLRAADIDSRMVMLHAHRGLPRRQIFPAISITNNHAILAIDLPGETVIVDPTTRSTPFGELPPSDQGAPLIVVGPKGTEIIVSPVAPPGSHSRDVSFRLELDKDGEMRGEYRIATSGWLADELADELMSARDDRQSTARSFLGLTSGRVDEAITQTASTAANGRRSLVASGKLTGTTPIQGAGAARMVRLDRLFWLQLPTLPSGTRTTPLVFPNAEARTWHVSLQLPKGVRPVLPAPVDIKTDEGEFQLVWTHEKDTLVARMRFSLAHRMMPPERYDALRDLLDRISAAHGAPVLLRPEAS